MKKPKRRDPKKTLRNTADKLLQKLIKTMYPSCLVCGQPINCGHHFVTKASSLALRYYLPNIIPICQKHHCLVHAQPSLVEPTICFVLGEDWYDGLMDAKKEKVKENMEFYQEHIDKLTKLINEFKVKP